MDTRSIMIVGVGGQGTLLASRILGNTLLNEGYDVKISEVHGMSQRGGSVVTYVRYGSAVNAPIIDKGGADVILAFELLEAKRALPYLKKGGTIIANTQMIDPMPVIMGAAQYPSDIPEELRAKAKVTMTDALALAKAAGNIKAVNVVLLGMLAKTSDIPYDKWISTLENTVPEKFIDINKKAFASGYEA